MKILLSLLIGLAMLVILVVGAGQFGLLAGSPPTNLGVREGRLQPPSANPNSVSSQAALYPDHPQKAYAAVEPLRFTGSGEDAMQRLAQILQQTRGTRIVAQKPDYLYAQCQTPTLKFTDDVEFWLDKPAGLIQVRSASRLGRKDFGANRARIEALRKQFEGTRP